MEVWWLPWKPGGEPVLQAQALEVFLLQARQLVSQLAPLIPFDQVKGPNIEKRVKALQKQVHKDLVIALIPAVLPVQVASSQ
jgi:hypothetical protein